MKTKQVLTLAIILVVLVIGVAIKQIQQPSELALEVYAPLEFSLESDQVHHITVSRPQGGEAADAVQVVRLNDSDWQVASFWNAKADSGKIERFLEEVNSVKGELRADDSSLFSDFGITENESYHVLLSGSQGEPLLDFRIGTQKSTRDLFVRKTNSDSVFLTDANLLGRIGIYGDPKEESPRSDYWVSTQLVHFETDQVKGIQVKRAGRVTSHVRRIIDLENAGQKKWVYDREEVPFAADATKIKSYLDATKNWKAQKVLNPDEKDYAWDKSIWSLTLELEEGEAVILNALKESPEAESYLIQSVGQPVIYQLSKYYFENFDIDDSQFFVTNPMGVDIGTAKKLVVRSDKKEIELAPMDLKRKPTQLVNFFSNLKNLKPTRLLFDSAEARKVKAPGLHRIEVQRESEDHPKILDVGSLISEESKEYAASLRGGTQAFAISEATFKQLFGNIDSLHSSTAS